MPIPASHAKELAQYGYKPQGGGGTLLDFARGHGLRVTAGWAPGTGHSQGSLHYAGSKNDPGAVDVDYRGVDYNRLVAEANAAGYNVLDEVRHPSAASTGPHYHLSKRGGGKPQGQSGNPPAQQTPIPESHAKELAQYGYQPTPNTIQGADSFNQLQSMDAVNPVDNTQHYQDIMSQYQDDPSVQPQASPTIQSTSPAVEDFTQGLQETLKTQQTPQPQGPGVVEGVGNVLNAVGQGVGNAAHTIGSYITNPGQLVPQIQQAAATEGQSKDGLILGAAKGLGGGALLGTANIANSVYDLPGALTAAYNNQPHTPGSFIPTGDLEANAAAHPVSNFVGELAPWVAADVLSGGAAVPENLAGVGGQLLKHTAVGAGGGFVGAPGSIQDRSSAAVEMGALGAGLGAVGEAAKGAGRLLKGKPEIVPEGYRPQNGFVDRNGQLIDRASKEPSVVDVTPKAEQMTANPQELTQAFEARKPQPEILQPGARPEQAAGEILGQAKFEPHGSLQVATRAGEKQPVNIERGSALPEGQPFEVQVNKSNSPVLDAYGRPEADIGQRKVPVGNDAALLRAEEKIRNSELYPSENTLRTPDAPKTGLIPDQSILDASGKPIEKSGLLPENRAKSLQPDAARSNVLEFPGREVPAGPVEIVGPSGQPIARPAEASSAEPGRQGNILRVEAAPVNNEAPMDFKEFVKHKTDLANKYNPQDKAGKGKRFVHPESQRNAYEMYLEEYGQNNPTSSVQSSHAEVFTYPETTAEQSTAQLAQLQKDAASRGGTITSIAEAERFQKQSGRPGTDHLVNFLDAGKNNQTLDFSYTPLGKGRAETISRSISPFALEKRTISTSTEFSNLKKQFITNEAVRDHLLQRTRALGVNVGAAEAKPTPAALKALIERLGPDERTHIYLHSHNFGDTSVGGGSSERGYRLDTITQSSLTGEAQNIPSGAKYQNEIAPALKALDDIVSAPNAPKSLQRVVKQMASGNLSKQSMNELVNILRETPKDILDKLCGL